MTDTFDNFGPGLESPAAYAVAVTPNDSTDLAVTSRGLFVGTGGNLKVTMDGGSVVTFTGIAGGVIHPLRVSRVWSTGTTAVAMVAVY